MTYQGGVSPRLLEALTARGQRLPKTADGPLSPEEYGERLRQASNMAPPDNQVMAHALSEHGKRSKGGGPNVRPMDFNRQSSSVPSRQSVSNQQELAQALARQAMRAPSQNISHPMQALPALGHGIASAVQRGRANRQEQQRNEALAKALAGMQRPEHIDEASWGHMTELYPDQSVDLAHQAMQNRWQAQQDAQAAALKRQ